MRREMDRLDEEITRNARRFLANSALLLGLLLAALVADFLGWLPW